LGGATGREAAIRDGSHPFARDSSSGGTRLTSTGVRQSVDDRPPICPACGVTMGIVAGDDETPRYVCLECGFSDELEADPA
jgi:hypothetical protein